MCYVMMSCNKMLILSDFYFIMWRPPRNITSTMLSVISMCGVFTVTILSSLMPPGKLCLSIIKSPALISGLATRHSAVFRHEEAPAWVSRAWTSLSLLAHGVILATNVNILIQVRAKWSFVQRLQGSSGSIPVLPRSIDLCIYCQYIAFIVLCL